MYDDYHLQPPFDDICRNKSQKSCKKNSRDPPLWPLIGKSDKIVQKNLSKKNGISTRPPRKSGRKAWVTRGWRRSYRRDAKKQTAVRRPELHSSPATVGDPQFWIAVRKSCKNKIGISTRPPRKSGRRDVTRRGWRRSYRRDATKKKTEGRPELKETWVRVLVYINKE